jgi:hypothetical protein
VANDTAMTSPTPWPDWPHFHLVADQTDGLTRGIDLQQRVDLSLVGD